MKVEIESKSKLFFSRNANGSNNEFNKTRHGKLYRHENVENEDQTNKVIKKT